MNSAEETNLSKELVSSKARILRFSVVIEKDRDGYFAFSPELQGCYAQGDTLRGGPGKHQGCHTPSLGG